MNELVDAHDAPPPDSVARLVSDLGAQVVEERPRQCERRVAVYEGPVQALVDELGRLPGVGPKSAQRIAFYLLKAAPEDAKRLAAAIVDAKDRVLVVPPLLQLRRRASSATFCRDERRDPHLVCVVEEPRDIVAIERTNEFRGRYHVLQGAISPIEGIGPEQLRVKELLGAHRRRGDHRGDPRDEPEHRR